MDKITVLTHPTNRLAKLWKQDGSIAAYDNAKYYRLQQIEVADIHELSKLLTKLEKKPRSCIIRGEFVGVERSKQEDPEYEEGSVRRITENFNDRPLHTVLIEVDDFTPMMADPVGDPIDAITEFVESELPKCFHKASYHWQLSNSAGHEKYDGHLKVHLWFWLKTPYTSSQLLAWVRHSNIKIDASVMNPVQIHYTSNPVFEDGVVDPVPVRSGFVQGHDEVELTIPEEALNNSAVVGGRRHKLNLAAEKDPVARMIVNKGMLKSMRQDGGMNIVCPREHLHTGGSGETSTIYYPNNTGGYVVGNFKCLHSHCVDAKRGDFLEALGYTDPDEDIESELFTGVEEAPIEGQLVENEESLLKKWLNRIEGTSNPDNLRESICKRISQDSKINFAEREIIAQAISKKTKALGVPMRLDIIRKMVELSRDAKDDEKPEAPEWMKDYVYVTSVDKFYRFDSDEWLTAQGFNAKFTRFVPMDENGNRMAASHYALTVYQMPTVRRGIYMPTVDAKIFQFQGEDAVNLYRPSTVPQAVKSLTKEDKEDIEFVRKHIDMICDGREFVTRHLTQWLAHNVQHPGVKIRWSPIIKGIQGDGKSQLANVLRVAMGTENVRDVSPKVLHTDFNGYAEGACVNSLEEIKMTGHNRHDVLNALKPLVTNDVIPIHRKGQDEYNAMNVTNYVAFTNYADALPLESEDDRRWFVVFTPFNSLGELTLKTGDNQAYFDNLDRIIRNKGGVLRKWLMDVPLDGFNPNGRAPHTEEKVTMVMNSQSDIEQIVLDIIKEGCAGVSVDVLSSHELTRAVREAGHDTDFNNGRRISQILMKLGYKKQVGKAASRVKWNGQLHWIWVKNTSNFKSIDQIREALNKTLAEVEFGLDD